MGLVAREVDEWLYGGIHRHFRTCLQMGGVVVGMAGPMGAIVFAVSAVERDNRNLCPSWIHRVGLAIGAFCRIGDVLHGRDRILEREHELARDCSDISADGGDDRIYARRARVLLEARATLHHACLLYTSPSPRDLSTSRMPSSA